MKRFAFILAAGLFAVGCGNPKSKPADAPQPDRVEVLAFHGAKRCPTCRAIETIAQEVVEAQFAEAQADSSLLFRIIDITLPENQALADKYEVSWSSLRIVNRHAGRETVTDLTQFAFANARSNPEKFRVELTSTLENLLKK